jgi:hypothetical protein
MEYPFSDFLRHVKLWSGEFRKLTDVPTRPYDPASKTVKIGDAEDEQAAMLRIDCMLARDGCSPSEQKYRAQRFRAMMRFIALHEMAFGNAGFFLSDDGTKQKVSSAVLRAVHETFCGEPLKHSDKVPVESVIERAQQYPPQWTYA